MPFPHKPVLPDEVRGYLVTPGARRFVDGTVGVGGHAEGVLRSAPAAEYLGIDRDDKALSIARQNLAEFGSRVHLVRGSYGEMAQFALEQGWQDVDGILLDLGMSSLQLDEAARGFSFQKDGPLDMRMDRRSHTTAAVILNEWPEEELARIFREYGEERHAKRLAKAVVHRRKEKPWFRTGEFAELVRRIAGRGQHDKLRVPARSFQALRIAVNSELDELESGMNAALDMLKPGGRLVIISFHSLEDRMVKQRFRYETADCVCPPELPECRCDKTPRVKILTRKPIQATKKEIETNPRAASAKLRAAEKL